MYEEALNVDAEDPCRRSLGVLKTTKTGIRALGVAFLVMSLGACSLFYGARDELPPAPFVSPNEGPGPNYIIGPLDNLNVFVWRSPELSVGITVRPDGYLSIPLIDDLPATGKTPTELARDIEAALGAFVGQPIVSVMVQGFVGPFSQQVRVVGEAASPQSIPYRANMTLLDVMIHVGGLTEFAAGDQATLVRFEDGKQKEYRLKIDSLIRDGEIDKNVKILPGDVLIIPESIL